ERTRLLGDFAVGDPVGVVLAVDDRGVGGTRARRDSVRAPVALGHLVMDPAGAAGVGRALQRRRGGGGDRRHGAVLDGGAAGAIGLVLGRAVGRAHAQRRRSRRRALLDGVRQLVRQQLLPFARAGLEL